MCAPSSVRAWVVVQILAAVIAVIITGVLIHKVDGTVFCSANGNDFPDTDAGRYVCLATCSDTCYVFRSSGRASLYGIMGSCLAVTVCGLLVLYSIHVKSSGGLQCLMVLYIVFAIVTAIFAFITLSVAFVLGGSIKSMILGLGFIALIEFVAMCGVTHQARIHSSLVRMPADVAYGSEYANHEVNPYRPLAQPQQGMGYAPQQGMGYAPQQGMGYVPQQGMGYAPQQGYAPQGYAAPQ